MAVQVGTPVADPGVEIPDTNPSVTFESSTSAISARDNVRAIVIGRGPNVIRGTVKHLDAAPVADVALRLAIVDDRNRFQQEIRWARVDVRSDEVGAFEFEHLPDGTALVIAELDGFGGLAVTRLHAAQQTEYEVVIVMEAAGAIGGRVVDEAGDAVAGAAVFPFAAQPHAKHNAEIVGWYPRVFTSTTDENGAFSVAPIFGSAYTLVVAAQDFVPVISDPFDSGSTNNTVVLMRGTSISGRVVSVPDQEGVAGLDLVVWYGGVPSMSRTVTNDTGAFAVTGVPSGEHGIELDSEDWVLAGQRPRVTVTDGAAINDVVVYAGRGGVVEGRVYDPETDKGIAGVRVSLDYSRGELSRRDGVYRIAGIRAGTYQVGYEYVLGLPGQSHQARPTVHVEFGGTHRVDIAIAMGVAVSGRVTTADGIPVAGALVSRGNSRGGSCDAMSREDGTFTVRGHEAGDVIHMSASKAGYQSLQKNNIVVAEEGLTDLTLMLETAGRVQGRVTDSEGCAAVEAVVTLEPGLADSCGRRWEDARTDQSGHYDAASLEPGTWMVCPRRDDTQPLGSGVLVQVRAGEITRVDLVLPPVEDYLIAGWVRDGAGVPQARAQLWAQVLARLDQQGFGGGFDPSPVQPTGIPVCGTTDAAGHFELVVHAKGRFRIGVNARGMQRLEAEAEAGDTNVEMIVGPAAVIEGQVISASSGEPLQQFELLSLNECRSRELPLWAAQSSFGSYYDPEGRFAIEYVEPGSVSLFARAPGCAVSGEIVEVGDGERVRDVVIRVADGATVMGTVRDAQGAPVAGARIFVGDVPEGYEQSEQQYTVSDALGAFVLDNLALGSTRISAYHAGHTLTGRTVTLQAGDANEVNLVLNAGGVLAGRVMQGTRPLAYARVGAHPREGGTRRETTADTQGRYRLSGLPTGSYVADAMIGGNDASPAFRNVTAEAEVTAGRQTNLDFVLPDPSVSLEGVVTNEEPRPTSVLMSGMVATADFKRVDFSIEIPAGEDSYVIPDLPAGEIYVTANMQLVESQERLMKSALIDASVGGNFRQDFHFRSAGALRVDVAGAFSEHATITLVPGEVAPNDGLEDLSQDGMNRANVNAGNPWTEFRSVEEGQYTVVVSGEYEGQPVMGHAMVDVEGVVSVEVELHAKE